MKETRSLRVAKINPFLQSNGIILKGNFILTFLVIFEFIMSPVKGDQNSLSHRKYLILSW